MTRPVAVLVLCAALVVGGCQRHVAGKATPTSFIDTLPLSLTEVQQISGLDGLKREVDTGEPTPDTYFSTGPCREMGDQRIAYGEDWTAFRSVADGVELDIDLQPGLMAVVGQHIVGYPDEDTAREVFDRRLEDVKACAALKVPGLTGPLTRPDDATAVWVTDGMTTVFTIKSAVLVDASAVGLPDSERIATDISQALLHRVN